METDRSALKSMEKPMVHEDSQDRRKGIRVEFGTEVTVTFAGMETRYRGSSRDLSLRGVFVQTDGAALPEKDTPCQVGIRLEGLEEELLLRMDGHVVRVDSDGYAIYFDSVDLDSFTHLKNIVRYNAPDSDRI